MALLLQCRGPRWRHVVVSLDRGRTVCASSLVGTALDQTFGGPDAGLLVHAFCR